MLTVRGDSIIGRIESRLAIAQGPIETTLRGVRVR
jgi:hypothetical protein